MLVEPSHLAQMLSMSDFQCLLTSLFFFFGGKFVNKPKREIFAHVADWVKSITKKWKDLITGYQNDLTKIYCVFSSNNSRMEGLT